MVEHRPVKAIVAGSSPASGANKNAGSLGPGIFIGLRVSESRTGGSVIKAARRSLLRG